jgi:hypothetical protein
MFDILHQCMFIYIYCYDVLFSVIGTGNMGHYAWYPTTMYVYIYIANMSLYVLFSVIGTGNVGHYVWYPTTMYVQLIPLSWCIQ